MPLTRVIAPMDDSTTPALMFSLRRLWPLAAIALTTGLLFGFGLNSYVDLEVLREHRYALQAFVGDYAVLAVLVYIGAYIVVTAVSCPAASLLTLSGGFLFGVAGASIYTVIGATLVFLAAKSSLGEPLRRRTGGFLRCMENGFAENALSCMLMLRLVPVFPCWAVNLAPAFLGVGLRTYVLGTFIGVIPGTVVYALAGTGIAGILDSGGELGVSELLTPPIVGGLAGLAILSLLPVVYKRVRARKG
jgi:uncharacterized membrane protein YdjX (TVP38/TMEM64 family)